MGYFFNQLLLFVFYDENIQIPDIFGGSLSDQVFLGGYRAKAEAEPMLQ